MSGRSDLALALHGSGLNCAQSVVGAFAKDYGIEPSMAHRVAGGMGAGYGRKQYVCGAVSGAVIVLGLAYGARKGEELERKEDCYARVAAFMDGIEAERGASDCRTLLQGLDLRTAEGRDEVKARGLGKSVCEPIIADCVRRLESILGLED